MINGLREAESVTVWTKPEAEPLSSRIWAPDLHYLEGKWAEKGQVKTDWDRFA
ncbi:hypothetical protein [Peribacillus frigoritolerans]